MISGGKSAAIESDMPEFLKCHDIRTLYGITPSKETGIIVWLEEFLPIIRKVSTIQKIFKKSKVSLKVSPVVSVIDHAGYTMT